MTAHHSCQHHVTSLDVCKTHLCLSQCRGIIDGIRVHKGTVVVHPGVLQGLTLGYKHPVVRTGLGKLCTPDQLATGQQPGTLQKNMPDTESHADGFNHATKAAQRLHDSSVEKG